MMDFALPTRLDAPIILLVGPDTDSRAAFHYHLNYFGFRVHAAENAPRALRLIALSPPAVVVTELSLPNGDGVTLCRTLKGDAFTCSLPIVGITGHADGETARVALDAGCSAVLVKPCLPERVREEVVRVLAIVANPGRAVWQCANGLGLSMTRVRRCAVSLTPYTTERPASFSS